jgi:hypothetical protein
MDICFDSMHYALSAVSAVAEAVRMCSSAFPGAAIAETPARRRRWRSFALRLCLRRRAAGSHLLWHISVLYIAKPWHSRSLRLVAISNYTANLAAILTLIFTLTFTLAVAVAFVCDSGWD